MALTTVMVFSDLLKFFIVFTDVSDVVIGAVFQQKGRNVSFFLRKFQGAERIIIFMIKKCSLLFMY